MPHFHRACPTGRGILREDVGMTQTRTSAERRVLLAGGTSDAGRAIARALRDAGAEVIVAGRSPEKLAALAAEGFGTVEVDLADAEDVDRMMAGLSSLDGLIPLVGGWRGGGGIPGQSDDDWDALSQALTAVRHTCRAAWPLLEASPAARVAVVSSVQVTRPLAGGANYAAVKAATEAWIQAVAHGFATSARDEERPQRGGCTIFRVDQLGDVIDDVAAGIAGLWDEAPTPSARVVTLA